MAQVHTELSFEQAIEANLLASGYLTGNPDSFDKELALDTEQVLAFVRQSQPKAWARLAKQHGVVVTDRFLKRLTQELDARGTLDVLRNGITDYGVRFRLASFKPASNLSADLQTAYQQNRLSITRQVCSSLKHSNAVDVVLFVNGLPVATAELKNPLTGQSVKDAMRQYREQRDPRDPLFRFKSRSLVHFAVDPDQVFMTTHLTGSATEFLPFNKGRGAGKKQGAGNPDNPSGYRTAYLWEQVWQRDSWLDILGRFLHLQKSDPASPKSPEKIIFPRYHQLQATRTVEAHAHQRGAGQKYLIQHSAGSGKSNTIAWLAHGLFRQHDTAEQLIFNTVVVVTDRRVLDRQLQQTIAQFEQTPGVVQKIDRDSTQLARALEEGRHIVITTLQKFPFVVGKMQSLSDRTFAVIIDEAHSSQTGDAARKMRRILAPHEDEADVTEESDSDFEDDLGDAALAPRPNLSLIALTATPKFKTIEIFGSPGPDGKPQPFHVYSMRQAIEEGFILDVLQNYTTYKRFWKLESTHREDPEVEARRARIAIARYVDLHPYNIAQKTIVMIEHFRQFSQKKIGGRAKAMVVTRSRLHAVRYKLAFDRYVKEKGYQDIRALVAFSGTVEDAALGGQEFTESGMNGFPESQLPDRFQSDHYQVLLVAEKYQTGYDQPLLHTMYVDKRLDGVKAVQTLSRLNRIHTGKTDTFVLDFVNDSETIRSAFAPYYDTTEIEQSTDPNLLYDLKSSLDGQQVYAQREVDAAYRALAASEGQPAVANAALNAAVDPAVTRYLDLVQEDQEAFTSRLTSFVRLYAFLLHIIPFRDQELEKLYHYGRFLLRKLPRRDADWSLDIDDYVALRFYRLTQQWSGAIGVKEDEGDYTVKGPTDVGTAAQPPVKKPLSTLINKLNDLFGLDLTDADKLSFDQIEEALVANAHLAEQARANDQEHYTFGFDPAFDAAIVERVLKNDSIFTRLQEDPTFKAIVRDHVKPKVYQRQREG